MKIDDVPSPVDLKKPHDAAEWAAEVNIKRPWRFDFFQLYIQHILALDLNRPNIIELGSGPGHLAKMILSQIPQARYSAVDFSAAMHQLSKAHLAELQHRVNYYVADFKMPDWHQSLNGETFDVVIIHQALHELRHKAYATDFHHIVKKHLMHHHSIYLVTDHLCQINGMTNQNLFMSEQEHLHAFHTVGFSNIEIIKNMNALCAFKVSN